MTANRAARGSAALAALSILALSLAMTAIGRGSGETYAVFLLPISNDLGWDRAAATSVYSVFMAATGVFSPVAGILFDRFGGRVVYVAGLAAMTAGYFVAAHADQIWQLQLCLGALCGFGAASIGLVPAQAVVSRWFERGLATALSVTYAGLGLGTLIMAPLAERLIATSGWRGAYVDFALFFGGLLLAILFLPWRRIGEGAADNPRRAGGVSRAAGPRLGEAIRTPIFWTYFAIFLVTAISIYGVSLQSVAYLVQNGFSERDAAYAFGIAGMLSFVGMTGTGMAADRFGYRRVATISYSLTILGILALALLPRTDSLALLAVYVVCFGLSMGARGPIITTLMARQFAGPGVGTILGAVNTGQGIGAASGALLAGFLFDATGGYEVGFVVSAAAAVVGAGLFWTLSERPAAQ